MGGLGNQMFQYAAGRAIALGRACPLALDLTHLGKFATPRHYELDCFDVHASLDGAPPGPLLRRFLGSSSRLHRENGFGYDASLRGVPDGAYLIGYFQSERYFAERGPEIRRDFRFPRAIGPENAATLAAIDACRSVSLHVRRGDYVSDAAAVAHHGSVGLDYYRAAVERVKARERDIRLFVFSDEPEWCKEHVRLGERTTYVDNNAGRGFEDLRLMSRCRHHILANSSFSWWGAWLNPDPGKRVVAPRRWFSDPTVETRDLLPPTWEVL